MPSLIWNEEEKRGLRNGKKEGIIDYASSNNSIWRLKYEFFEDSLKNNGYSAAEKIKIPTLILHGDKDTVVPLTQSIKTSKIIKGCKLEIIKGGDHLFREPKLLAQRQNIVARFAVEHV